MTNFTALKESQQSKSNPFYYMLIALLIFHFVANCLWIKLNQNPVDFDPVGHTLISINMANYIKTNLLHFNLTDFLKISSGYPVFTHIVGAVLALIFGVSFKIIQMTGTIFFLITIFVIYLYIKEITKKPSTAFFTAFFYSFFISIVQYSRFHMLDIPLTVFIICTIFYWERFKNTHSYRYLILSAITAGLAQATKWHTPVFLLIPFLFLLFDLIRHRLFTSKKFIMFTVFSIAIFVLIAAPWYVANFSEFLRLGLINYRGEADDPHNLFGWDNIIAYPWLVINFQTHFIGFVFLIISIFTNLMKLKKYLLIPFLTLVFSYIFFTFFIINKNIRVIFPLMPYLALFFAVYFERNFINGRYRVLNFGKILINGIIIGYLLISFLILSFGWPVSPDNKLSAKLPLLGWIDLIYLHTDPVNLLYGREPVDYRRIINQLIIQADLQGRGLKLVNAVHLPYFHQGHLPLMVYEQYPNNINFANNEILNNKLVLTDVLRFVQKGSDYENMDAFITVEKMPILPQSQADELYKSVMQIHEYLFSRNNTRFYPSVYFPMPGDDRLVLFIKR